MDYEFKNFLIFLFIFLPIIEAHGDYINQINNRTTFWRKFINK